MEHGWRSAAALPNGAGEGITGGCLPMTPDVRSRERITRTRWIGLLVVASTVLIALTAVAVDAAMRQNAEKSQRSEVLLLQLQTLSSHLSALEWQAIGEGQLPAETREDAQSTSAAMEGILGNLAQLDPGAARLRSVKHLYGSYELAMRTEFQLIAKGDLEHAHLVDEEQVDPAFEALSGMLSSTSAAYGARARRASRSGTFDFALVLSIATAVIALLFWRFQKAQTATKTALSEQQASTRREKAVLLLGEMGEQLRACQSTAKAYGIIASSAERLFPEEPGALYVFDATHETLKTGASWGGVEALPPESGFAARECWALRKGTIHVVTDPNGAPSCRHLGDSPTACYLCVPMTAHDETLGVLHLRRCERPGATEERSMGDVITSKRHLALTFAEHVAMALVNMRLQESLRDQAIRDPLSGLFNRRYMEESLERELSRAARAETPVAVIMLDIDYFKHFNDRFGHAAGDAAIVALAALLRFRVRNEDVPCRYGGEEFVLVLPGVVAGDACQRAEELREAVQGLPLQYDSRSLPAMTVSLGVAVSTECGSTSENLLKAADDALYRAKAEGRNRVVLAHASSVPV